MADPHDLADRLGAAVVIPLDGHNRPAHIGKRCAVCGGTFNFDQWDRRHTPGLDVVHEGCCDCGETPA